MYAIAKDSAGKFAIEFNERDLVEVIEKAPRGNTNPDFPIYSNDRDTKGCITKVFIDKGDSIDLKLLGMFMNLTTFTADPPEFSELKNISEWAREEDFDKEYSQDPSIQSENFEECGRLETFGEDLEKVKEILAKTPKRVWTVVEGDVGTSIIAGFHLCNRMSYIITVEEWKSEDEAYLLCFDLPCVEE